MAESGLLKLREASDQFGQDEASSPRRRRLQHEFQGNQRQGNPDALDQFYGIDEGPYAYNEPFETFNHVGLAGAKRTTDGQ